MLTMVHHYRPCDSKLRQSTMLLCSSDVNIPDLAWRDCDWLDFGPVLPHRLSADSLVLEALDCFALPTLHLLHCCSFFRSFLSIEISKIKVNSALLVGRDEEVREWTMQCATLFLSCRWDAPLKFVSQAHNPPQVPMKD